MSKKKRQRYYYSARIVIKDKIFKNTMVIHCKENGGTPEELMQKIMDSSEKNLRLMDKPEKLTTENINKFIETLRRDGWGKRKIKNHFKKFGIHISLPKKEKTQVPKNQKILEV